MDRHRWIVLIAMRFPLGLPAVEAVPLLGTTTTFLG
jgi:hypothetical protein